MLRRLSTMKRPIKDSISLNDTEQCISNLLLEYTAHYNNLHPEHPLVLRITGGWVRDKLLGKESNDLDIAINEISGEEFATGLQQWVSSTKPLLTMRATHLIKKNPEKSKHLETCTTQLYGLDIDFVNLRSERYTDDSRVPQVEFGTEEEDALRRDATLNALFYNLNRGEIEDFTGTGRQDLANGVLRTPLPPLKTFLDDPLRVLRLIRFASRFDFSIESNTLDAMKNPSIKDSLDHKISRERVGVEIDKILVGKNPPYGLNLVSYVNLSTSVFSYSTVPAVAAAVEKLSSLESRHLAEKLHYLNRHIRNCTDVFGHFGSVLGGTAAAYPLLSAVYRKILADTRVQKIFWLAAVLEPYRSLLVPISAKKSESLVQTILKEGLRFGKQDTEPVVTILREYTDSQPLLDDFFANRPLARSTLGLYLRKFPNYYDINIVTACFLDLLSHASEPTQQLPLPTIPPASLDTDSFAKTLSRYESLLHHIDTLGLQRVNELKPLVDGKTVLKTLNLKPGPWMGKITEQILVWQMDHPEGTQQQCLDYVRLILSES